MTHEARSAKHGPDLTHVILTLVGITGLVLFILACRPSWSPNGRKVLYSYIDEGAKKAAVAVFDRNTRTSHVIFEWWDETRSNMGIAGAQWTKNGEKAIVTIYEEEGVQLLVLPVNGRKPVQAYTLKKMDEGRLLPYPQVGNNLFLTGGKMWIRVNLETGEIFRKETNENLDCLLYDAGTKVFYLRQVEKQVAGEKKDEPKKPEEQNKPDDAKKQPETPASFELGELDQRDLSLHPTLTLAAADLKSREIGGLSGMADVDLRTLKLAASEEALEGKPARILVIGKSGIEQILDVGIKEKAYDLGNPQWSRDGKKVYVNALIPDEKTKRSEFVVVEVSLDGTKGRVDRIDERPTEEFGEDFLTYAQIALSPDGNMIAVTNGHLEKVPPKRRGLFLLDLSRSERSVNFYTAPALPVVAKTEKE